ncbi:MAG: methionine--tRNA ligase [Chitinophagales bacterium]|nr:methionine--tRNA ligase [Chitinophagales bacterium]MCZ2392783.1 methionine--tRNA ligase [Chitinophagales bacterium]
MCASNRYTITAALPYANGPLHIGHLAGAYIGADIYARYLRLRGKDIVFVCGSDEHGAAITIKAIKEGVSPREIVDKFHTIIRDSFSQFGISFDIYHRTSEPIHYDTSQEFFRILNDKDAFDIQESEQYYDEIAQQFLADRYIIGTCPKCNNENAYGDQCEKCGSTLSPTELINPRSTISGGVPILKKTRHWYLKLNEYQEFIQKWILSKKGIWKSHVYGQCMSWIDAGLQPRAMTRDLNWGIPVPPEIEGSEGKVLYVWLDAPIGYISATRQLFKEIEEKSFHFAQPQSEGLLDKSKDEWKKYWQSEDTTLVHFIGKDNIVFHCITFPAILKATGHYILPENVPANEFMNLQGDKISTSRNWAVWLHEYLEEMPGKQDELRYTLIANMPENKDSEFTWQDYQSRVNNELVANLGNFINRVSVLVHKYYQGIVPHVVADEFSDYDQQVLDAIIIYADKISVAIESFKFRDALMALNELSSVGNKYLADFEPWKLVKVDPKATERILFVATQLCGGIAVLAQPLLPFTANKLSRIFGVEAGQWIKDEGVMISAGTQLGQAELLFEKIDDSLVNRQIEKLENSKRQEKTNSIDYTPIKTEISFDDFSKLDIRTGIIVEAEKVPKADKLLKLKVDLGFEIRTIVSGIAESFSITDVIGQKVSVIVNLAPRKLKGVESNGMILMAEDNAGKLFFVQSEAPLGMIIR